MRRVLNLSDPRVASAWGLSPDRFRRDDLTPCQEVARAARKDGYEAIRFPAASGTGENMAIFIDRLHNGSTVAVEDAEELVL